MQYLDQFLLIAVAHIIALMSPGPDFAIILKQSISHGREKSLWTSFGISIGILVHVSYTVLGIGLIISKSIIIYTIIKYLAALYLIYLGIKALKSNSFKLDKFEKGKTQKEITKFKAFSIGFFTNALNPKATLFFLSLFTVIVDINTPLYIQGSYAVFFVISTFIWFGFLSFVLTGKKVRGFFNSFGKIFDKVIGVILIALGIKVAMSEM